jgi:hypothetical protein
MLGTADFTASSGTTVVLANGATAGDLIRTESFFVSSVLNAIPAVANAVTDTYINTGAVTPAKLSTGAPSWDGSGNLSFNSGYGSSAVAYGCRAWVNFNGTGTVAIRASGNVSSITDNGTGDYTINFTNAFADANYNAVFGALGTPTSGRDAMEQHDSPLRSTTQLRIYTLVSSSGSLADSPVVSASVFR